MSPQFSLNGADLKKWGTNLLIFLAPVAIFYLSTVIVVINTTGIVSAAAFALTASEVGAIALYVLNALIDLVKKYASGPIPPITVPTQPSTPASTPPTA